MSPARHAIETRQLSKSYPEPMRYRDLLLHPFRHREIPALDDVTLAIAPGASVALLGPNGAGKTTLLKILATLVLPTRGQALVDGLDVTRAERQIRSRIGYVVSEERSFYWRLSGRENLAFFATLQNIPHLQARTRLAELAALLGLEAVLDKPFQGYSTGTRQKLAIARALLTDPPVLLMDEPTRSLDPGAATALRYFIREALIGSGTRTLLFATHNLAEAELLGRSIAVLHRGRLRAYGTPQAIRRRLGTTARCRLVVDSPAPEVLARASGLLGRTLAASTDPQTGMPTLEFAPPADVPDADILHRLVMNGVPIRSFSRQEVPLEDLFRTLTEDTTP